MRQGFKIAVLVGLAAGWMHAAELKPETLKAWDGYTSRVEADMRSRVAPGAAFLWMHEAEERRARVRAGEIVIEPVKGSGAKHVANGLIHHWVGAAFIPHATLRDVLVVTHDYGRYDQIYAPKIARSHVLRKEDRGHQYSLVLYNRVLSVTAALQSEYNAKDFPVDGRRWYQISKSTNVQEVLSFGDPNEQLMPPGKGRGFVWRLENIARYEQTDDGVYMELEALGLSRDVPVSMRWLLGSVISRVSRSTLESSLRQTREHVVVSRPQGD